MPTIYPNHRIVPYVRWAKYIHQERNAPLLKKEVWEKTIKDFESISYGLIDSKILTGNPNGEWASHLLNRLKQGERTYLLYKELNTFIDVNGSEKEE